jgi:fructose-bisphosphate aldolase, class I
VAGARPAPAVPGAAQAFTPVILPRGDVTGRAAGQRDDMTDIAQADVARAAAQLAGAGKGVLAADESVQTMNRRLEKAGIAAIAGNRRAYREMLVTTPHLSEGLSGVIFCDETFRQALSSGETFPEAAARAGLLPGIKVDAGVRPLPGATGETVTEGLDGLRERLACYVALGARFAKWRAVYLIGGGRPSWQALRANSHALARYATLCHEAGLVPIVEPEVLMDGGHTAVQCSAATSAVLLSLFGEMHDFAVAADGVVLQPSMVLPGTDSGETAAPRDVAAHTLRAFDGLVPDRIGGIAFLSGGQSPAAATSNLAALLRNAAPWPLTFCFGRALVDPALAAWRGDPVRVRNGQRALANRVACNLAALRGGYRPADAERYALG